MRSFLISAFVAATALGGAFAVEPDEVLADASLEARAREVSSNLRCVVCQSQNIDDSNAPLAKDMRLIVRERLTAGDTDEEVYQYLVSRYGDYVLMKPPVQTNTLVLWAAPIVIFAAASAAAWFYLSTMRRTSAGGNSDGDGAA